MSLNGPLAARGGHRHPVIAIAGAGIGGLALALALKQRGFSPVVFERKSEEQLRNEGVFLTVAPNGINALRALGVAESMIAAGVVTAGLAMFNERGRRIGLMDYGQHGERFGAPSVTIGRGALSAVLLDAAISAGIELRFGQGVSTTAVEGDSVRVSAAGLTETFDALVACDGIRSTVRQQLFPELPAPRYTGLIGTGGFIDVPGIAPTGGIMNMTFGKRAFFGYLAEPGHPVMWFNTYPAPEAEVGPVQDPAAYARFVAALHRDDPLDNFRILSAVPALDRNYPIYDMPELSHWQKGPVLLMGDAAHAVAPHSGQGASMAIEDGLVLAACIEDAADVASAFARFFALRRERTRTVIQIGRAAGSQKHAQSWLALRLRDLILPLFIPMGVKAQERVFPFRADQTPLLQPVQ